MKCQFNAAVESVLFENKSTENVALQYKIEKILVLHEFNKIKLTRKQTYDYDDYHNLQGKGMFIIGEGRLLVKQMQKKDNSEFFNNFLRITDFTNSWS